jgi:hypothetical protein
MIIRYRVATKLQKIWDTASILGGEEMKLLWGIAFLVSTILIVSTPLVNGLSLSISGANGGSAVDSEITYKIGINSALSDKTILTFGNGVGLSKASKLTSPLFGGSGDFEDIHSAQNKEGDSAIVWMSAKNANSWTYSYWANPSEGAGLSGTRVEVGQKVTIYDADWIHGHATAYNSEEDRADTCTSIDQGSLIGYSHSAIATKTSAESKTSWDLATGEGIWSCPNAQNKEGDSAVSLAEIPHGTVKAYSSSALAKKTTVSTMQKAEYIEGAEKDSTLGIQLEATARNQEFDEAYTEVHVSTGSIGGYDDSATATKAKTDASVNLKQASAVNGYISNIVWGRHYYENSYDSSIYDVSSGSSNVYLGSLGPWPKHTYAYQAKASATPWVTRALQTQVCQKGSQASVSAYAFNYNYDLGIAVQTWRPNKGTIYSSTASTSNSPGAPDASASAIKYIGAY